MDSGLEPGFGVSVGMGWSKGRRAEEGPLRRHYTSWIQLGRFTLSMHLQKI